jgi:hypothetical protein
MDKQTELSSLRKVKKDISSIVPGYFDGIAEDV